jgi:uncharacterized integral membrane protein
MEPPAERDVQPADSGAPAVAAETRADRFRRRGRHARLYTWAALLVATLVILVALVVANSRRVKISWVVGSSRTSLIWIILVAAIAGWLAGVATSILFRRRTRRPR